MTLVETASVTLHVLVGAIWVGTIVFAVGAVLPLAREGDLNAAPLESIGGTLRWYTRLSAVVILATGLHLIHARHTVDSLIGTGNGHLVLTMFALWLVTVGLVEVGTGRLVDGAGEQKVRAPGRDAGTFLKPAAVTGALTLVVGALLGAPIV